MADLEYNKKLQSDIQMVILQMKLLPALTVDEYTGKWEQLLENRGATKQLCDYFFSLPNENLTEESQNKIAELRRDYYPTFLCSLGKCYIALERYPQAKEVLQEAMELGSLGGQALLGMAYAESVSSDADMQTAYSLLKNADSLSPTAEKEIANTRFQESALFALAILHRIVANDLTASYNCLIRIMEHDWTDEYWNQEYRNQASAELSHFKKGLFGGLKYIE